MFVIPHRHDAVGSSRCRTRGAFYLAAVASVRRARASCRTTGTTTPGPKSAAGERTMCRTSASVRCTPGLSDIAPTTQSTQRCIARVGSVGRVADSDQR